MRHDAIIWTEGKTDAQHLQSAQRALNIDYKLSFEPNDGTDMGDDKLFKQCQALAKVSQGLPTIFIFDRDNPTSIDRIEGASSAYKSWGNNVYSFAIPVPQHRTETDAVCIELFYQDHEIQTADCTGRRLFLSSEFNPTSGKHLANVHLSVGRKMKLPSPDSKAIKIIDSEVYDSNHRNAAMSKADFAENISKYRDGYGSFDFSAFGNIFSIIGEIIAYSRQVDLLLSGFREFLDSLEELDKPHKLASIVEAFIRASKLMMMTFSAATLRFYARSAADTDIDYKKVRAIHQILTENFTTPSLSTLIRLTTHLYHLIDDRFPVVLHELKAVLAENPVLGPIGVILEDLERVIPPDLLQGRAVNKQLLKRPILQYLLPELAKYEVRIDEICEPAGGSKLLSDAEPSVWVDGLALFLQLLSPLHSLVFRSGTIDRFNPGNEELLVVSRVYQNGMVSTNTVTKSPQEFTGDRLETIEMRLSAQSDEGQWIDVFPFLQIYEDKLYFYMRSRAIGYEYIPVFGDKSQIVPTKRKFNHTALGGAIASGRQFLFWAPVTPTLNPTTGVKANIPPDDPFIGRRRQIDTIVEEVVQIPNQHGLVYGPGGVGKTALLIELSRKLFEGELELTTPFKNIIWVSAKPDYYDPKLDLVETKPPQYRTLDQIWATILDFHEFGNVEEYDSDTREYFVFELLKQDKTLLVLDNFEAVSKSHRNYIVQFFNIEAKKYLIDRPDNFKVLLTSREIIPSGFHQIPLKGLDKSETKRLLRQLDVPYRRTGKSLTNAQRDQIYEATLGIPLIIKHCHGQIFEYSRSVEQVLRNLKNAGNKVVEFSFAEIFKNLNDDEIQLRIIVLLELADRPLLTRQIADILAISDNGLEAKIETLVRFQCVIRSAFQADEKYSVNPDLRVLATRLVQEHARLAGEIRNQLAELDLEKRLDYTAEEYEAAVVFDGYLLNKQYLRAEDFIRSRLEEDHGNSILLNLRYAKFLKDVKHQIPEAIERLEHIRKRSDNHPHVLRSLMESYMELEPPKFEEAYMYAGELEQGRIPDHDTRMSIARFYTMWSRAHRRKIELDPIENLKRAQKYKELADRGIKILKGCGGSQSHEWYHLMAICQFAKGDDLEAKSSIDRAIANLPGGSAEVALYENLRDDVVKEIERSIRVQGQRRAR